MGAVTSTSSHEVTSPLRSNAASFFAERCRNLDPLVFADSSILSSISRAGLINTGWWKVRGKRGMINAASWNVTLWTSASANSNGAQKKDVHCEEKTDMIRSKMYCSIDAKDESRLWTSDCVTKNQ
jgi:hypothetical protein